MRTAIHHLLANMEAAAYQRLTNMQAAIQDSSHRLWQSKNIKSGAAISLVTFFGISVAAHAISSKDPLTYLLGVSANIFFIVLAILVSLPFLALDFLACKYVQSQIQNKIKFLSQQQQQQPSQSIDPKGLTIKERQNLYLLILNMISLLPLYAIKFTSNPLQRVKLQLLFITPSAAYFILKYKGAYNSILRGAIGFLFDFALLCGNFVVVYYLMPILRHELIVWAFLIVWLWMRQDLCFSVVVDRYLVGLLVAIVLFNFWVHWITDCITLQHLLINLFDAPIYSCLALHCKNSGQLHMKILTIFAILCIISGAEEKLL